MNVSFACPECERVARVELGEPAVWQCPGCEHRQTIPTEPLGTRLLHCAVCNNAELYKKKDFPHWLGLTILTAACLLSLIPYYLYMQWLTWTILIGSAIFDGLLFMWVGDVVVCYRCNAHHRRVPEDAALKPFDLGIGERYRQERIRREQLQSTRKSG